MKRETIFKASAGSLTFLFLVLAGCSSGGGGMGCDEAPPPLDCQTGYHEEAGSCVKNTSAQNAAVQGTNDQGQSSSVDP